MAHPIPVHGVYAWRSLPRWLPATLLSTMVACGAPPVDPCPDGTWRDDVGSCLPWTGCPSGTFVAQLGTATTDQVCSPCPAGSWSEGPDASDCRIGSCSAGTVQIQGGDAQGPPTCAPCDPGVYCSGGDEAPVACGGETWDDDADAATACVGRTLCPPGTWAATPADGLEDRACTACPTDTYAPGSNAETCLVDEPCEPGSVEVAQGTATLPRTCQPCEPGAYCAGADAPAEACAAGTWNGDPAEPCSAWTDCEAGSYVAVGGTSAEDRVCAPCSEGTYSDTPNTIRCLPSGACPAGTTQVAPSSETAPPVCAACAPGEYCPGGESPGETCAEQSWDHDGDPATPCAPWRDCLAGQYVVADGSATNDRSCAPCDEATWSSGINSPTCSGFGACPSGTVLAVSGTPTSPPVCEACAPGTHCPGGEAPALPCEEGTWTDDPAQACRSWSVCVPGEWVYRQPDSATDRGCAPCGAAEMSTVDNAPRCTVIPFSSVAVGPEHACALRAADGTAVCWGDDYFGEASGAPAGVAFERLSLSADASCGIRATDRHALCWGSPDMVSVPTEAPVAAISAAYTAACLVRETDGLVQCWGHPSISVGLPVLSARTVAVGAGAACALETLDGTLTCWGEDPYGVAAAAPTDVPFASVSLGPLVGCGIRSTDHEVQCWGDASYGQLTVPTGVAFSQVAVGVLHVCGIRTSDGALVCWGQDPNGLTPVPPAGLAFTDMSASRNTCGVTGAGQLRCFGGLDQTGVVHGAPNEVVHVGWARGSNHACALQGNGNPVCFGNTSSGESTPPPAIFSHLSAGDSFTCGVQNLDESVACWGKNDLGQATPPPGTRFLQVASGRSHTCGIRATDRRLECWGDSVAVAAVPTAEPFRAVSLGAPFLGHSGCGIRDTDGGLACWGQVCSTSCTDSPLLAAPAGVFEAIAVAEQAACAIEQGSGRVACWGDPSRPQVGLAPTLGVYTSVALGNRHACAVERAEGRITCWGDDRQGLVSGAPATAGFSEVLQGGTCALRADGALTCWGSKILNPL